MSPPYHFPEGTPSHPTLDIEDEILDPIPDLVNEEYEDAASDYEQMEESNDDEIVEEADTENLPLAHSPAQYPYLTPSPTDSPPLTRWSWLRNIVNVWRREDDSRVPDSIESATDTQVSPITGEIAHYTIPLLIARLFRHESYIEELRDARRAVPSPTQMHNELGHLRNDLHRLRFRNEHSEGVINRELEQYAHRLEVFEEDLMNLRNTTEDLESRIRSLEIRDR